MILLLTCSSISTISATFADGTIADDELLRDNTVVESIETGLVNATPELGVCGMSSRTGSVFPSSQDDFNVYRKKPHWKKSWVTLGLIIWFQDPRQLYCIKCNRIYGKLEYF